ncbi:hypothetical protein [Actinokineospora sp. UTMC 2448]|uniref:hypothetical protein n=1 Tax=Actinokineospora sp. UTMC 2448 TaxID=2268449 RepID=UPI002164D0B7|nr:hypothetical protein [Actinokineospora sp. UTMC 2448]UVS76380.1 hypothetical protein Actkin_00064 [Actinokineospora sp. UTMC 2448]
MTAPGNPLWVRNLAELVKAQREPLAAGADDVAALDAAHWTGPAADGYTETRLALSASWRAALDIHETVSERVEGYSTFVHELPHLWAGADGAEQARLTDLWRGAADRLAAELIDAAADLDRVGVPEPAAEPEPEPPPADPVAAFAAQVETGRRLHDQVLTGRRRARLRWV